MEAQSEGSAGPQQINATSLFDPNATLHAQSLPPPSPADGATPPPAPTGPLLRGHNRTHSGHVLKSNVPSSSYAATAHLRNPWAEVDQVESSAASDTSNASFYTAAEDGVESSGPSFADRPARGGDRPALLGPSLGDRFGRGDRPSPLGTGSRTRTSSCSTTYCNWKSKPPTGHALKLAAFPFVLTTSEQDLMQDHLN